jgi:hypothetical protein
MTLFPVTLASVLMASALIAWLVGMLALFRIWFNGIRAGDCGLFLTHSVVHASYNREYRGIFAAAILVAVAIVAALNILFFTGHIRPSDLNLWGIRSVSMLACCGVL